MRLGLGSVIKSSTFRLACVATLVFSGLVARVDRVGALAGGDVEQANPAHLDRRAAEQHHAVPQLEGQQVLVQGDEAPLELRHRNRHGHHHHHHHHHPHHKGHGKKHNKHHDKKKKKKHPDHHHHHHHHHKNHKDHKDKGKNKHKHKHKHKHDHDKPKKCDNERREASFGILICNNRTISAVYCPNGKLKRPDFKLLSNDAGVNIETLTLNNNKKKPCKSKLIAHLDIIRMKEPCPNPVKRDIDAAIKRLSSYDRKLLDPYFNLGFYSKVLEAESIQAANLNLRNNGGGGGGGGGGGNGGNGIWNDKCTAVGTFCGSSIFGCNTYDDGVYQCDKIGGKPVLVEMCPVGECINRGSAAPSGCKGGDCACKASGEVCGSNFSESCGLKNGALYFCKTAGSKPVFVKQCESDSCDKDTNKCKPDVPSNCKCPGKGSYCGSSFDAKCGYKPGVLYVCNNAGDTPSYGIACPTGECPPGATSCPEPPNPCVCKPEHNIICGSTFAQSCGLEPNSLYQCTGAGAKPSKVKACSGECLPNDNKCNIDRACLCKETGHVCGSSYPSSCSYEPETLYICHAKDTVPERYAACAKGCDKATSSCIIDDCSCKTVGSVCGGAFDKKCELDAGTLYSCREIGGAPTIATKCLSGKCDVGLNICVPDPCECKSVGKICGSSFPASCNLTPNLLYTCDAVGRRPTSPVTCPSGVCKPNENACAVDPCACFESGLICGTGLSQECGYKDNILFRCEIGKRPVIEKVCESGVCKKGEKACSPPVDPCKCSKAGDICGSSFPESCKLEAASLYTCAAQGSTPIKKEECKSKSCPKNSDKCTPPPVDPCLCAIDGKVCGTDFEASCGFDPDTLYQCKKGEKPTDGVKCDKGTCKKGSGSCDKAVPPECLCTKAGDICGSSFP
ncbi:hypothetical protein BGZ94_001767, partial [Podila epigama]